MLPADSYTGCESESTPLKLVYVRLARKEIRRLEPSLPSRELSSGAKPVATKYQAPQYPESYFR